MTEPPSDLETRFAELLNGHYGQWAGIARVYAGSAEVEDLLQEVCLQVWRALPGFEGRSAPGTWAYRIALNTALGWDRAAKRRGRVRTERAEVQWLPAEPPEPPEGERGQDVARHAVERFAATLSKIDRAVLLVYLEKMPAEEAASITGLSCGATRVRMHRLKDKFKKFYEQQESA